MREENSNWFSKWEDQLPSPQDLTPLSQSLITPHLALAFNIPNPQTTPHHHAPPPPQSYSSAEFDSPELSAAAGGGADEPARTLKRPRLVWTPQLHKRFVDAVAHLGIKNAVPKTIMQLMSVDGLTRENVASHLQKYRLYLKRMQGISGNSGGGAAASAAAMGISGVDAATDRLFGSTPVPAHFLHPGRANAEHYSPFVPVAGPMHQIGAGPMHQQFRHFGGSPPNGQFDQHVLIRQSQVQGIGAGVCGNNGRYAEDFELASNGRKVLTLFPNGGD